MRIRMKSVSVVIPTYNRSEDLKNCIQSILKGSYVPAEIIIVDNASTDNTEEIVKSFKNNSCIRYIHSDKNLYATGGRILGTSNSSGDYILYIDDDNIIFPNMIESLVSYFESHSDAGLVAPVSVYSDRQDLVSYIGAEINLISSKCKYNYRNLNVKDINYSKTYTTKIAMQNCFMVSRECLEKTGGFDPIYKIMFDESDFGMKIFNERYTQYVNPKAITIHIGGKYIDDNDVLRHLGMGTPERGFLFARNRNIFMRRYAPFYGKILFFALWMPLFAFYYITKALKFKRKDIAIEYFKGLINGLFCNI